MNTKNFILFSALLSTFQTFTASITPTPKSESNNRKVAAIGTIGTVILGGLAIVIYKIFGKKKQSRVTINTDNFAISSQNQATNTSADTSQAPSQSNTKAESTKKISFHFKPEDLKNALATDSDLLGIQSIINIGELQLTEELEEACLNWVVRKKSLDGLKYFTEKCKINLEEWKTKNPKLYDDVYATRVEIATDELLALLEQETPSEEALRECIVRGANVYCPLENGQTILTWSVTRSSLAVVNIFTEKADLSLEDINGDTPLVSAIKNLASPSPINKSSMDIAIALVSKSNIKEQDQKYGLITLAIKTNKKLLELLLNAGASPNQETPLGTTPLIAAAFDISADLLFDLLIKKGALVDFKNSRGITAAMDAIKGGRYDQVVTLITQYKANVLIPDNEGKTLKNYYNKRFDFSGQQHPTLRDAIDNAEQHKGVYKAPTINTNQKRVTLQ